MRVFITGATGFVGSAVVNELIKSGHHVIGLARSEESANKLIALGVEVINGTLENEASLQEGVSKSDAVIHLAFNHDFSKFADNAKVEANAVHVIGEALKGSDRSFVVTSGVAFISPGRLATEDDTLGPLAHIVPRKSEQTALEYVNQGVKVTVVRLPPSVHGEDDHGFVPLLIGIARSKGYAGYFGEGTNVWSTVHRLDAARLYVQALEKQPINHIIHAIAEQGVPVKQIAESIGKNLNIPVQSLNKTEAEEYYGWFFNFATIDCPTSSEKTKAFYNWNPVQDTLLVDLDKAKYF
eukprot:gene35905-48294_t